MSAAMSVGISAGPSDGISDGISAVLAALDAATAPVRFFIRDDDAGWDDERLFALLRCTERARVPIDLAVIPQATGVGLAAELVARCEGTGGRIGLHQHGHAHSNFEAVGRKCEFGPGRDLEAQRRDLIAGRDHLRTRFGARLDAFFTPPWNRCSDATPRLLAELGYTGLSRDRSAPLQRALPELRVDVDWCRHQRLVEGRGEACSAARTEARREWHGEPGGDAIGLDLARHVRGGATVGLMLHHAQMSDAELGWLGEALSNWKRHPNARWRPMRELLRELPPLEPLPPLGEGRDGGLHAPRKETT